MDYLDLVAGYDSNFFWFKAKNNLIKILASKACRKKKGLKILVIGVGTGAELKALSKYGRNYVIDKNPAVLPLLDKQLYFQKKRADVCNLPYQDDFFDAAVSLDVFEHISNDCRAAAEILRVLKKDGPLIFTVPAFPQIISTHDQALGHLRRYDKQRLNDILSGYSKIKFYYWNSLLFLPISLIRLFKKYQSKSEIDHIYLPAFINGLFYILLSLDNLLIKRGLSLPIGLTITGFCFKR